MAPVLRLMARHPQLDLSVAYCTLSGVTADFDAEFGRSVRWDVPLLDGYSWQEIPRRGPRNCIWGLYNPGLGDLIRRSDFDAVLCFLSYLCASFWISYVACQRSRSAFIFGTDATSLIPRNGEAWKALVKKQLWPQLFSLADQVIVPSSSTRELMLSLGVPMERVTLTPYSVDNDWWFGNSQKVNREAVRASWGAQLNTFVALFCAKLQSWKRPQDVLRAFVRANLADSVLIFAGDGAQRAALESEARSLGVHERVRFLGFVNQSELPAVYTAADVMVLPSEYEPFAVVVNEAFCCGCPVIASDRVGAAKDLIAPLDPRLIFPCTDVDALSGILRSLYHDRKRLRELGIAARRLITRWSPKENIAAIVESVERAVAAKRGHLPRFFHKNGGKSARSS